MSAADVTPEAVKKLREDINVIVSRGLRGMLPHEDTLSILDALESAWRERDTLRAELEAYQEEVQLTNEHEHQIIQERNEARAEVERLTEEARRSDAELARVRRNHLRRMCREAAEWAYRMGWDVLDKDREWVARNSPRLMRFVRRCREAIHQLQDKEDR